MSERRAKGLCYFCDELFTLARSQTLEELQIHVMEIAHNSDSDQAPQSSATPPNSPISKPLIYAVLWQG